MSPALLEVSHPQRRSVHKRVCVFGFVAVASVRPRRAPLTLAETFSATMSCASTKGSPISSSSARALSAKFVRRWRIPSRHLSWLADMSLLEIASSDEYRERSSSLSSTTASRMMLVFSPPAFASSFSRSFSGNA